MSLLWFTLFAGCFGECAEMIQEWWLVGGGWWWVGGAPVPFSPFALFLPSPFTIRH